MLVPVGWLQDYLGKKISTAKLLSALERAGLEIDGVRTPSAFDRNLIVAEVKRVRSHPGADKLTLVDITTGKGKRTVVCGAANVAAGQKVVYAPPGTILPDGTKILTAQIRGQASPGMIASARELGLGDDHSGILVLEETAPVGKPIGSVLGQSDTVIDLKSAANRPDLQSLTGLAREVAAQTRTRVKNIPAKLEPESASIPITFNNRVKKLVPRYALARLRLPANLPATPNWLAQRLGASGIRPVNLIVDVTNYVMLETGQPLHAFDANKVSGKVSIRTAKKGENITTLDGKARSLGSHDLVIADSRKIIGIAGVMGARNSEVRANSRNLLIEAANLDGNSVRKTAINQGLRTEASARFERQLPTQLVAVGLNRATELLRELAKAKLEKIEDELNVWPWVQHVGVRPARLSQLAGTKITTKQVIDGLRRLGFVAEPFDIVKEAKKHLGKPYVWGASFKTHGADAFDCGYLADYIYSLIGVWIGHNAYEQWQSGSPVKISELRPGDILFRGGPWIKLKKKQRGGISHNVIYIGRGKVVDAKDYERKDGKWTKLPAERSGVVIDSLSSITEDPEYLGARRLVEDLDGWIAVTIPWWRPDVKSEEDVLEEVIKLVGLDDVAAALPAWRPGDISYDARWLQVWDVRSAMAASGLFEVVTHPFVSQDQLQTLGLDPKQHLKLRNPRSVEQAYLRSSLMPGLLLALARNSVTRVEFGLFEEARVFLPQLRQPPPMEIQRLGVIVQHPTQPYGRAKTILDNLAMAHHLQPSLQASSRLSWLQPGRQAIISVGGQALGYIGQLRSEIGDQLKIKGQVGCLELDLDSWLVAVAPPSFKPISPYQVIRRDLTVVLDQKISWQQVRQLLEVAELSRVSYGGEYHDPALGRRRALTLQLIIEPEAPGTTDEEANRRVDEVAKLLKQNFGAIIKD